MSGRSISVSSRGRWWAIACVVLALVVTAVPVGGATSTGGDQLVVGSQHDNFGTSDELNPQTLTNLTVDGTGESASVTLADPGQTVTSFESYPTGWSGDTGVFATSTTNVEDGTYSLRSNSPDKASVVTNLDYTLESDTTYSAYITPESGAQNAHGVFAMAQETGNTPGGYLIWVDEHGDNGDGKLRMYRGDGSGDLNKLDQTSVSITAGTTYRVDWNVTSDGTINSALYKKGASTPLTTLSPTDPNTPYLSGGVALRSYHGDGYFDYIHSGQGGTVESAQYVSATHEVSNAETAAINIEQLSNVSVDATVRTDGGTTLATDTFTSANNHTLNLSETSSSQLETVLDVEATGANPEFEMSAESILFTNHAPNVSNLSPDNGTQTTDRMVTFDADVSDPEFPTAQGDTVNATLWVNDNPVASQSVSTNTTINETVELTQGGENSYYWTFNDSYGATTTTDVRTVIVPETLYFRNETDTSQLVDDVTVTVQIFGGETLLERNTSDGTLSLSGIDVSGPFIVSADADGYASRVAYLTSLYAQNSIYLLPENTSSVESRFVLDDPTGEYGPQTLLIIERPLSVNGTVGYQSIYADRFGTEGVTAVLEQGVRYRLKIRDSDGNVQTIGPYRADVGETVTVRPGTPSIELPRGETTWSANATLQDESIIAAWSDPAIETSEVTISVHERRNESNQLGSSQTFNDVGNATVSFALTANQTDESWVVEFDAVRNGESIQTEVIVEKQPDTVPPELAQEWRTIVGVSAMLLVAGAFSVVNVGAGAIALGVTGGILWYTGWLAGTTSGATIVVYLLVAVLYQVYSR